MELQFAEIANVRLWKTARIMALACFALTGLLLIASLQVAHPSKAGTLAKSVEATQFQVPRAL